jgi:hypothetical protein
MEISSWMAWFFVGYIHIFVCIPENICNYSGPLATPPAAAYQGKRESAGTPRAPAGDYRPLHLLLFGTIIAENSNGRAFLKQITIPQPLREYFLSAN